MSYVETDEHEAGRIIETGSRDEIFGKPRHPYTQALLRSIPTLGLAERDRLDSIKGMIPHPFARPQGCQFHNRCDQMMPGICDQITPEVIWLDEGREVRCLLYGGAEEAMAKRDNDLAASTATEGNE